MGEEVIMHESVIALRMVLGDPHVLVLKYPQRPPSQY
jgi:hypothetical protein